LKAVAPFTFHFSLFTFHRGDTAVPPWWHSSPIVVALESHHGGTETPLRTLGERTHASIFAANLRFLCETCKLFAI